MAAVQRWSGPSSGRPQFSFSRADSGVHILCRDARGLLITGSMEFVFSPKNPSDCRGGSNADNAQIDNGIGGVTTPGSTTVSPTSTTTYTITASCGSTTQTAQVTIYVISPEATLTPTIIYVENKERETALTAKPNEAYKIMKQRDDAYQAKLKEALSVQPAAADPKKVAEAEQRIKELEKERDDFKLKIEPQ